MKMFKFLTHSTYAVVTACSAVLLCAACTADDESQPALGSPIPVTIGIEGVVNFTTRSATALSTGTAYLTAGGEAFKRYVYSSETGVTSANPLVWTSLDPITVYGYYIDGGETIPNSISTPYYTVDPANASFMVGKDVVQFGAANNTANLTLRQQLAKVTVTVSSLDGSVISDAKLGGGLLYTTGTFASTEYNDAGYATGGENGTGWTRATNLNPETLSMTKDETSSSGNDYVFYAYVLPQQFTNTTVDFLTVKVTSGELVHQVGYRLTATLTMKAGCTYNLSVDKVTNSLYLNTDITVDDIPDSDNSNSIDNGSVDTTDPGNTYDRWIWF